MPAFSQGLFRFLHDPPPDLVFEISEAGIAFARSGAAPGFHALPAGVIATSPLVDNVLKPEAFQEAVRSVVGSSGGRKRGRAVLILPDYCARVSVLDFDTFPTDPKEQLALVRFRMRKSVPFDVETAVVGYHPQPGKGPTEVVVVVAALEIVARYEAPFRAVGLHPGFVTTSALAFAELNHAPGISILARLNGRVLTVLVMNGISLRLVRTVELTAVGPDEVLQVLFPTVAYIEDEMGSKPSRLALCGFGEIGQHPEWLEELGIPVETLRSRFGLPNGANAGLHGYLESSGSGVKVA